MIIIIKCFFQFQIKYWQVNWWIRNKKVSSGVEWMKRGMDVWLVDVVSTGYIKERTKGWKTNG